MALRLEAMALRLEAMALGWRPSLLGWRPWLLGWRRLHGGRWRPVGWRPGLRLEALFEKMKLAHHCMGLLVDLHTLPENIRATPFLINFNSEWTRCLSLS